MMKKTNPAKRGGQEGSQPPVQPEKVGWVRKFCGRGIFREIWKNRFVVLKGDQLLISEKEPRDEKTPQEAFDLKDYERCEELRKPKSRSKRSHCKFSLTHCKEPGHTAPTLVFLAVSPEEKESWITVLNSGILRAKNRILDEVTVEEESSLAHPTRNRARIQHSRRPPTRGHLMAVTSTSTSDGMLTLDLIQEEEEASPEDPCRGQSLQGGLDRPAARFSPGRRRSDSEDAKDSEKSKAGSLPRRKKVLALREAPARGAMSTPQVPRKKLSRLQKTKWASMEEILSSRWDSQASLRAGLEDQEPDQLATIQELVALQLEKTRGLLAEAGGYGQRRGGASAAAPAPCAAPPSPLELDSAATVREVRRLLGEASSSWRWAQEVLREAQELRQLYRQLCPSRPTAPPQSLRLPQHRRSLM
ncbi:LOW QUALITY PROTEIN: pleckstrin homology domain-containing family O member 1 [Erythrolamprus reginae]|uniref:LOW QUALITY PROTEIN: pleckstrin homology domain-containing family O member 1 n=1 Tax=Erythrolamprus reginae TaxID=121349 RepID=UPI00396CF9A1